MGIFVNVLIEKGGDLNSVSSIMKSRHCYGVCVNTLLPVSVVAKTSLNKYNRLMSQCNSTVGVLCIPAWCWVASPPAPVAPVHGPTCGALPFSPGRWQHMGFELCLKRAWKPWYNPCPLTDPVPVCWPSSFSRWRWRVTYSALLVTGSNVLASFNYHSNITLSPQVQD